MNWNEYFYYDECSSTGLRWRVNVYAKPGYTVPLVNCEAEAGYRTTRGAGGKPKCILVTLNNTGYPAHMIVWELFNGEIPEGVVVDHLDRNPWNNKINNLKLKSIAQNNRNRSKSKTNTSGKVGVGWHKTKGCVTHAYASWRSLDGKKKSKYFLISKFGKEVAFLKATMARDEAIAELNKQGAGYTDTHGT